MFKQFSALLVIATVGLSAAGCGNDGPLDASPSASPGTRSGGSPAASPSTTSNPFVGSWKRSDNLSGVVVVTTNTYVSDGSFTSTSVFPAATCRYSGTYTFSATTFASISIAAPTNTFGCPPAAGIVETAEYAITVSTLTFNRFVVWTRI